ncbi:hypothetical protein DYB32_007052 [Aphanomyces invadans]|uniref:Transposase IS30-like HTH domain-containing protein n=1 Tax=Aphanomyces invadans TaxID=157072 RepID=A0A3R7CX87_9STRA|nr:hypothetical protein DYB32_007052 [Aphanomyces invadans]
MGHGPQLTAVEQGQVLAWAAENLSVREIGRRLGRNHVTVAAILRDPSAYGSRSKSRPKKLTAKQQRRLYRANETLSCAKLNDQLDLSLQKSTVPRYLRSTNEFKYIKMYKAPKLTKQHMENRDAWATKVVDYGEVKWAAVVFSDEKKWNLDGPDGLKSYRHCIGREQKAVFSRQNGGGSLMVWGGIWADGETVLAFLDGSQNSHDYVYTLSEYLLPSAHLRFGTDFVFQQDNASIHTSVVTKEFLREENIAAVDWPALSQDLNRLKSWGYLGHRMYGGGKQYSSKEELKSSAILLHWNSLDVTYLQKLVSSMKTRSLGVVTPRE